MAKLKWADLFMGLAFVALTSIAAVAITTMIMPHNVDYYYVSGGSSTTRGICVQAHWTWHFDETVYCSDDKDKALDFEQKANANLKK